MADPKWEDTTPTWESTEPVVRTPDESIPAWKSTLRGGIQGATAGFGDELGGGIRALEQKGIDLYTGNKEGTLADAYRSNRDELRAKDEAARTANPKSFMVGEAGGGLATLAVPGMGEANIAKLAALGGLQGLGSSNADLTKDEFGKAAFDVGEGAAIGGLTGAVGKGLTKVLSPEAWQSLAQSRGAKALGFTKRLLNTPQKIARAGETAQTMLDKGVITSGATPDIMNERVANLINQSGSDIGKYLKNVGMGYETQSAVDALNNIRPKSSGGNLLNGGLYDQINSKIDTAIDTIKANGPVIPFDQANSIKSLLQDIVNWNSTKFESRTGKAIAQTMRQSIDDTLEDLAKNPKILGTEEVIGAPGSKELTAGKVFRTKSPEQSEAEFNKFLDNKKAYGAAQEAQDALANRLSSQYGNKSFGLTDTVLTAPIAAAEMIQGRPPLGAIASLAGKASGERFGNQTISAMSDSVAKGLKQSYNFVQNTLKVNPRALGKYAAPLMNAAQRGTQQVMINHWVLENTDPGYREMIHKMAAEQPKD